jgi:hypothetical protein
MGPIELSTEADCVFTRLNVTGSVDEGALPFVAVAVRLGKLLEVGTFLTVEMSAGRGVSTIAAGVLES